MADTNQDDKGQHGEEALGQTQTTGTEAVPQVAPVAGFDVDAGKRLGDTPADIANQVDSEGDVMRIKAATSLLNTFNYAIQVQAGRTLWKPSDYHRFIRALICIDAIGRDAIEANATGNVPNADTGGNKKTSENLYQEVPQPNAATASNMPRVNFVDLDAMAEDLDRHTPNLEGARPSAQSPLSSLPRSRKAR